MPQLIRFISRHLPLAIKLLRMLLNIVFLLVMWLPFCIGPDFDTWDGYQIDWKNDYLYRTDDTFTPMLLEVLIVICVLVQLLGDSILRKCLKAVSLLISSLFCLISLASMTLPMQDFMPHLGCLFLGTIFPILFCWFVLERLQRHPRLATDLFEEEIEES
jgi:hypothetical protein